jgi:hypothetical protein
MEEDSGAKGIMNCADFGDTLGEMPSGAGDAIGGIGDAIINSFMGEKRQ